MTARYLTRARLRELAESLGERDFAVLRELSALRFASGSQLAHLCFAGSDGATDRRAARRALLRLHRLGVIERLPRAVGGVHRGSSGFVYYLGAAGQRLSMERGWLPQGRPRRTSLPGRLFVSHAVTVAELHARLAEAGRGEGFELIERAAEPACWRSFAGGTLKPDTYIRLGIGDYELVFFIEVDRGTEGSGAIERQIERYLSYHRSGHEQDKQGVFPKVLWLAQDGRRAEAIAELLTRWLSTEQELFAVAEFHQALATISNGQSVGGAL